MFYIALAVAKCVDLCIKALRLGAGSTWPGEVALRIDPHFVRNALSLNKLPSLIIAGTNGKTTTSLLIAHGLRKKDKKVITNPEGANLLNGVASTLVKNSTVSGRIDADYALFESDENALVGILSEVINPKVVTLLNLFRDQLDRYGEVHVIAKKWKETLTHFSNSTQLICNGDDPLLAHLGSLAPSVSYFGASKEEKKPQDLSHDVDSIHCPQCGSPLVYTAISYSHLGDFQCRSCNLITPQNKHAETYKDLPHFKGIYNKYNLRAAIEVLSFVLTIERNDVYQLLTDTLPAFGRQEKIMYKGKQWIIILSKNPAGFNQSIAALSEILNNTPTSILIVLNDRVPDGTDVSWIWDVEFDQLYKNAERIFISGDRTFDMAIRMETARGVKSQKSKVVKLYAEENITNVVHMIEKEHTSENPIIVLATYTGVLEVRKILTGRALL